MYLLILDVPLRGVWAMHCERMKGIEPSLKAWEAFVLPLNYIRLVVLLVPFNS